MGLLYVGLALEKILQDRLRELVRQRVRRRNLKAQLAREVKQPGSWVTFYLNRDKKKPMRKADFDTSIRIMRFLGISLDQLLTNDPPLVTSDDVEIRNLWRQLDDDNLRKIAKQQIAGLLPLVQLGGDTQSIEQPQSEPEEKARRSSGKRRDV